MSINNVEGGAPHSSTLAWKIPWTEEPGRLRSMGLWRVKHDWATSLWLFTFLHWRRKWQPTPMFLPGESQGRGSLDGLPSVGSHRVGHDWSSLAAAAAYHIYFFIYIYFCLYINLRSLIICWNLWFFFLCSLCTYVFFDSSIGWLIFSPVYHPSPQDKSWFSEQPKC